MRFLFVDRILGYEKNKSMVGLKNVTRGEPFFYMLPDGTRFLSPAVITEATMQLGSWLIQVSTDFRFRPVLLADEATRFSGRLIQPGDQLRIEVEIVHWDDEVVHIRGRALLGDEEILHSELCRAYLMPLEDFNDPERVRADFHILCKPDRKAVAPIAEYKRLPTDRSALGQPCRLDFIDEIIDYSPAEQVTLLRPFSSQDQFFATHFPRRAVVPGVLMLTCLGEAAQLLFWKDPFSMEQHEFLYPRALGGIRFRSFIEPGDVAEISIARVEGASARGSMAPHCNDTELFVIEGRIKVGNKVAMQGRMGFMPIRAREWLGANRSAGKPRLLAAAQEMAAEVHEN